MLGHSKAVLLPLIAALNVPEHTGLSAWKPHLRLQAMVDFSRREIVGSLILVGSIELILSAVAPVRGAEETPRKFVWRVPKPFEESVRSSLTFEGQVEPDNERGLTVIFVGVALLFHLARSVLRLHDELQGGTVIDVRGEEILIERDLDLLGGTIVIVSKEGASFHERKEFPNPADLVSAIKGTR